MLPTSRVSGCKKREKVYFLSNMIGEDGVFARFVLLTVRSDWIPHHVI